MHAIRTAVQGVYYILFSGKSAKNIATRAAFLAQMRTKFFVGWGSPQTILGELTALPQTYWLYLGGLHLRVGGKGKGTRGMERRGGRGGTGREVKGRKWKLRPPPWE